MCIIKPKEEIMNFRGSWRDTGGIRGARSRGRSEVNTIFVYEIL